MKIIIWYIIQQGKKNHGTNQKIKITNDMIAKHAMWNK